MVKSKEDIIKESTNLNDELKGKLSDNEIFKILKDLVRCQDNRIVRRF